MRGCMTPYQLSYLIVQQVSFLKAHETEIHIVHEGAKELIKYCEQYEATLEQYKTQKIKYEEL